jgi:integrase
MSTTQPIRNKNQIRELANYYLKRGQLRNYVLIVVGVHTALRISDLLRITWGDVYDFEQKRVRSSITVTEKKTGKTKTIALNKTAVSALAMYASQKHAAPEGLSPSGFLFESRRTKAAISRVQAYRIIRDAAKNLGMERASCHSLRKTFGYHAWKSGVSPAVIMEIYSHSSFVVTRRYLGVTRDDTDGVYLNAKLLA